MKVYPAESIQFYGVVAIESTPKFGNTETGALRSFTFAGKLVNLLKDAWKARTFNNHLVTRREVLLKELSVLGSEVCITLFLRSGSWLSKSAICLFMAASSQWTLSDIRVVSLC